MQPFGNSRCTPRLKPHSFSEIQCLSPVSTTRLTFLRRWLSVEMELTGEGWFVTQSWFGSSKTASQEQGLWNTRGGACPSSLQCSLG